MVQASISNLEWLRNDVYIKNGVVWKVQHTLNEWNAIVHLQSQALDPTQDWFVKAIRFHKDVECAGKVVDMLSMPQLSGDLMDVLMDDPQMSMNRRINFCEQVIRIICRLHSRGIAHRDLKPENFLVDSKGDLHLTDFEFSVVDTGAEETIQSSGSPAYAAPELFSLDLSPVRPFDFNIGIDAWALGCLLFVITAGKMFVVDENGIKQYCAEDTDRVQFVRQRMKPDVPKYIRVAIIGLLDPNIQRRQVMYMKVKSEEFAMSCYESKTQGVSGNARVNVPPQTGQGPDH